MNILDELKDILYELMLNSSKSESMTDLDNQYDINQLQDIEEISSKTSSDQEVLEHWVLFICWQFCSNLCLVIEVFLDSDLLFIKDKGLFVQSGSHSYF